MRYWWVNQNQTYRQEIAGGYLWSPKRNANGVRNPFHEFMREASPGDPVRLWTWPSLSPLAQAEPSPVPQVLGKTFTSSQ
jgi:hypothetical protein